VAFGVAGSLATMAACGRSSTGAAPTAGASAAADRPVGAVDVGADAKAVRTGPCSAAVGGPPAGCPQPPPGGRPTIGGCSVFPADNPWNQDVSTLPVHPNSAGYLAYVNASGGSMVHPDFGSNPSYGIPYSVVP
jgi:hypothetical protein